MTNPKIAIVSDWSTNTNGFEQFMHSLHEALPNALFYTDFITPDTRSKFKTLNISTAYSSKFLHNFYKFFPIFQEKIFKKLNLSKFDIIITNDRNSMKIQKNRKNQIHICYFRGISNPKKSDQQSAQNVDIFIADSAKTQKNIKQHYNKPSTVIHPPVDVDRFEPARIRGDYYLMSGHQLSNNQIKLAKLAATKIGIKININTSGNDKQSFVTALNNSKGYISLSPDSFDPAQVEALAAGSPVIAYNKDIGSDIVQNSESGILFDRLTIDSLTDAIQQAEQIDFLPGTLRRKAKRFDKSLFITKIRKIVYDQTN